MSEIWYTYKHREQVSFTDDFKNEDGSSMSAYQSITQIIPKVLSCIEQDYQFVDWSTLEIKMLPNKDGIITAHIFVLVDDKMGTAADSDHPF